MDFIYEDAFIYDEFIDLTNEEIIDLAKEDDIYIDLTKTTEREPILKKLAKEFKLKIKKKTNKGRKKKIIKL